MIRYQHHRSFAFLCSLLPARILARTSPSPLSAPMGMYQFDRPTLRRAAIDSPPSFRMLASRGDMLLDPRSGVRLESLEKEEDGERGCYCRITNEHERGGYGEGHRRAICRGAAAVSYSIPSLRRLGIDSKTTCHANDTNAALPVLPPFSSFARNH
ncbi:hypothetical protein C8R45DRAFT_254063 [Mycena sanguinolenta]|nr:hypothetical protein C8R45DRAFT_254063 [Mycena sanguinolenta]